MDRSIEYARSYKYAELIVKTIAAKLLGTYKFVNRDSTLSVYNDDWSIHAFLDYIPFDQSYLIKTCLLKEAENSLVVDILSYSIHDSLESIVRDFANNIKGEPR